MICCDFVVMEVLCSYIVPVRNRLVSSTYIISFILKILRLMVDINIACTGEVDTMERWTMLIEIHDGGPYP